MGMIRVKAANAAIPVPHERFRRARDEQGLEIHAIHAIRDGIVEVPDTRYYRRRIAAGDLIAVKDAKPTPAASAVKE